MRILHRLPQVVEIDLTTRKLKEEKRGKAEQEKNLVERLQRLGLQVHLANPILEFELGLRASQVHHKQRNFASVIHTGARLHPEEP